VRPPAFAPPLARGCSSALQPASANPRKDLRELTPSPEIPVSQGWRQWPGGPLLVVGAAGLLTACQRTPEPPSRPPLAVQAQEVQVSRFADVVDTVSTLEALGEVQLAAQTSGRIQTLVVRQGDQVRQGQLLMVLDQTQAQADVARLRAETETKRLNFKRYDYLVKQGAASAIQRDQFRQDYISSRMNLVARIADLGFRDLRAPISGTVGDVQAKVGDV